jgi:hypothetical protein
MVNSCAGEAKAVRVWFVTLFFLVPLWPVVPIFLGLRRRIRRAREAEVRSRKPEPGRNPQIAQITQTVHREESLDV